MWAWLPTENVFLTSALQGMAIASLFAFIILIVATRNIFIAVISLSCVMVIQLSVVAIEYFLGWEIGVSESISMVIMIGLSVDYVIHLSSDYMHSAETSRHKRMKQAYSDMGVSIFSGCVTSFGSGVFLLCPQILVFNKLGVLITMTVAISFIVAIFLFGAIMHAFGP